MSRPERKKTNPKSTLKTLWRLFSYMRRFRWQLILVVLFILISAGCSVAGTYLLKPLINDYILPLVGQQHPDLAGFIGMLGLLAGVYLLGVLTSYGYNRLMVNVGTGTLYEIRVALFTHLQTLPVKYFDTHTHGELMSRFTNDVDTLREMLSMSFPQLIHSAFSIVGVFAAMLLLSPLLTVLTVVMLVVILFAIRFMGGRSSRYYKQQQKSIGDLNGYIEEMISGQKVVKVFRYEERAKEEFEKRGESLRVAATNANTFANILMPVMGNISYLQYALTAIAGGVMAISGWMDLGTIASYLQYTRTFSQPITQLSQQTNAVLSALAGAERIFEVLDEQPEQDDGYVMLVYAEQDDKGELRETEQYTGMWAWKYPHGNGQVTYTRLEGDVRFLDVTFGYDPARPVLHDVSFYAKPGQKIALVGSTGAGKTTITNLINRFYDLQEGKILYDGINIGKIKKEDLRRSLSMVLQDTHLFSGTVMENIRYGNLSATDEEVVAAAKLANAHSFIRHLSEGYNTLLTDDGINLSQGQRQLLAIARAAVANPPVLILDEATSSIDTRTEALIEKGMNRLMEGRTVFVIAHRLSTVRNSDAILVLEQGRIVERGNHEELLQQKGRYHQLYHGMFELS